MVEIRIRGDDVQEDRPHSYERHTQTTSSLGVPIIGFMTINAHNFAKPLPQRNRLSGHVSLHIFVGHRSLLDIRTF
jgi:hypothetical protein